MHVLLANRAAARLFGRTSLIGLPLTDLIPERLRAAHVAGFTRFLSTGDAHVVGGDPIRLQALSADGSESDVELHLDVIGSPSQPDVLVVGTLRPISERIAFERDAVVARYVAAVLGAAFEMQQAPDVESVLREVLPVLCRRLEWDAAAVWMLDQDRRHLHCTATWEADGAGLEAWEQATVGLRPVLGEGLVGGCAERGLAVVVDDLAGWAEAPRAAVVAEAGLRGSIAFPLAGRQGVQGVVELVARTLPPTDPEVVELLTTVGRQAGLFLDRVRDEMDLRAREEDLRASTALLWAQIHSAPQAVLAVSSDRRVLACNRRFEELWNLPPGSVKVGGPSPALQPESLAQVKDPEAFEAALRWGHVNPSAVQQLDVPLVDGRVIEGVAAPIVDADGRYHGRIWFLTDDTDRRRAEADRAELLQRLQLAQRSQAFLLDASRVLAGASGYAETLERLATVAVPTLGDICLIDVVDEQGDIRRMAARHADRRQQSLVDELRRRFPPDATGMHPSVDVTHTRQSRWSADMSDEFLRATTRDEEHFALVKRLGFTSYMTVPLVAADEVLGTVTLVSAGSGRRFGLDDLALAEDLADQVAQVVAKARRYDQEHRVAHTLQANLLPAKVPSVPGLRVALRYEASPREADVGGDWFDVQLLASGSVRMTVGDVAGHDIWAAATMGQLRSACRALTTHAPTPADLVDELRASWDDLGLERIATLVVVQVDPWSGAMAIASAGHPPPLLVRADGADYLDVEPTPPLGAPATDNSPRWFGAMPAGSALLMYTDGLVERRTGQLEPALARLAATAAGHVEVESLCDHVLRTMVSTADDDIALLALSLADD